MKLSASTKFVLTFLIPMIFVISFIVISFALGEISLLTPLSISSGIAILLFGSALRSTTSHPDFFIKKIFGVYERERVSLFRYIFNKESISADAKIPYYKGGDSLIWIWEEMIPVFGGEKTYKNKIDDVFSPNDGISIETHLETAMSFSPEHMSAALRKCGEVRDKITEENLKNMSAQFFNISEPEFKGTLKKFAEKNIDSKYIDIINSVKEITTALKTNIETLTDIRETSNGDHLVENLGILVSKYNLEMKPDAKVEAAKENITVAKLNKEAALNEIQVKKDVLTAIGEAIETTTGSKPKQEAMTNLALSMFGNSNNILFMGNSSGKTPAVAINTQKKGGNP
ncbi:MAG: hypothetical protein WC099_03355 [Candidatus Paceibacterota bacterium]